MILQFLALLAIMATVFFVGYYRGKTIKEREMNDMDYPELTDKENKKHQEYYDFCKAFDELMSEEDDPFSGNISKSARTETEKEVNF